MIKTRKRSCAGIRQALLAGAALWSLPALAAPGPERSADPAEQPAAQDDAAGSAEPAPPAPNEILVTAQRRLQSIQDVPLAVTALDQSNLFDSAGATGMFVADASSGLPTNLFLLPARRVIAVAGVRF